MARLSVQCSLPYQTGIPEDVSVNVFAIDTSSVEAPTPTELGTMANALEDFYSELASFLHPELSGVLRVRAYDIDDPEPRVPLIDTNRTNWFTSAGTGLPEEVAIALSFTAVEQSGTPAARRRGRIYIGPLRTSAIGPDSNGHTRPSSSFVTALDAAVTVLNTELLALGWLWCVWSRADDVLRPCREWYVDDALDTQRRRGVAPTSRTVLLVV